MASVTTAKPDKFQLITFGKGDNTIYLEVERGQVLKPIRSFKILGGHIDHRLNFNLTCRTSVNQNMGIAVNALA